MYFFCSFFSNLANLLSADENLDFRFSQIGKGGAKKYIKKILFIEIHVCYPKRLVESKINLFSPDFKKPELVRFKHTIVLEYTSSLIDS